MTTIGLSYSLVKISTKCAPALAEMWDKYFPTPLSWAKNCHDKWQAYIPAQCVEALGP